MPTPKRAEARVYRGIAYGQRGQSGDVEREITDFTTVIDMPDAPAEVQKKARNNLDLLLKPKELPPKKKRK